jgi:hypothetical protein
MQKLWLLDFSLSDWQITYVCPHNDRQQEKHQTISAIARG